MTNTPHTPVPWEINKFQSYDDCNKLRDRLSIVTKNKQANGTKYHISLLTVGQEINAEANAEFICRAVNNHDKLLEALKLCHEQLSLYVADCEQSAEDKEALDAATAVMDEL